MKQLTEKITRQSSWHTYFIIKCLVDSRLVDDCFSAYAYFRWFDDQVDIQHKTKHTRQTFVLRQKKIIRKSYEQKKLSNLSSEETWIQNLITHHCDPHSKLASFISNFVRIIEFDAMRKGRQITKKELSWYTRTLSIAVTDGIEFFVNNHYPYHKSNVKYKAAEAAHLVHILRDYTEDIQNGYFNIPKGVNKKDLIRKANIYFDLSKSYIDTLPLRTRLAAWLYTKHFKTILKSITKNLTPDTDERRVIVVGAGIGGIATAIQLAKNGYDVTIYEKNSQAGGRCGQIIKDGHVFDTGPTMYLFPRMYENFFHTIGENIHRYIRIIKTSPTYKLFFSDNSTLFLSPDLQQMKKQLEKIENGSFQKLTTYLTLGEKQFNIATSLLCGSEFRHPWEYFNISNLVALLRTHSLWPHYFYVGRFFRSNKLRAAFTFQDSYLSLHPYTSPSIYSMFTYSDLIDGNFLPEGGMYNIIRSLVAISRKNGVKINYNSPVKNVLTKNNKATGIELENGATKKSDLVVINTDIRFAYRNLLPTDSQTSHILNRKSSCSAVVFHWGMRKRYDELKTHNLFFSENYKSGFDQVLQGSIPPANPHFYIQAPSRTDPTRAPDGEDTLTVMVPINYIDRKHPIHWETYKQKVRNYILNRLVQCGLHDISRNIKFETSYTPVDWEHYLNLSDGSIYGLHHSLDQLGYLRSKRQHKKYKNVFFVGASTHPGSGLPTVLQSAQFTTVEILRNTWYQPDIH